MPLSIQQNIPLAPFTTIQLGGSAKEYASCTSNDEIIAALSYAKEKNLPAGQAGIPVHVLGGGSNTIFSDTGFNGLVLHVQTKGITLHEDGEYAILTAQAGEGWDTVVQYAISHTLAGIECLSGIPGSCGGTPFQNVGAYGQEVAQTISHVDAINRTTLEPIRFSNSDCQFGYRTSRFKEIDRDKYIITSVSFRLTRSGVPSIRYGELYDALGTDIPAGKEGLAKIRSAVLALRRKKSMLVDHNDPNSVSCGSFFTNPIITSAKLADIKKKTSEEIPFYEAGANQVKLSAAYLVEHAGFQKGTVRGNVGISEHHSLALVNKGGTTAELLAFATEIQTTVQETFDITLALEPLVISY